MNYLHSTPSPSSSNKQAMIPFSVNTSSHDYNDYNISSRTAIYSPHKNPEIQPIEMLEQYELEKQANRIYSHQFKELCMLFGREDMEFPILKRNVEMLVIHEQEQEAEKDAALSKIKHSNILGINRKNQDLDDKGKKFISNSEKQSLYLYSRQESRGEKDEKYEEYPQLILQKNRHIMELVEELQRLSEVNNQQKDIIEHLQYRMRLRQEGEQQNQDIKFDKYKKEISLLERQVDELRSVKQHDEMGQKFFEISSSLEKYKNSMEQLQIDKNQLQRQVWQYQSELENLQEEYKRRNFEQINLVSKQKEQIQKQLLEMNKKYFLKEQQFQSLNQRYKYLDQLYNQVNASLAKKQVIRSNQITDELNQSVAHNLEQMEKMRQIYEKQIQDLKSRYQQLESCLQIEKKKQKQEESRINQRIYEYQRQISNLEKEIQAKQSSYYLIAESNKDKDRQIEELELKLVENSKQNPQRLIDVKQQIQNLLQQITSLQKQNNKLSKENHNLIEEKEGMEKNIFQLTDELEGVSGFFNLSQQTVDRVIKKYEDTCKGEDSVEVFSFMDLKQDLNSIKEFIDQYHADKDSSRYQQRNSLSRTERPKLKRSSDLGIKTSIQKYSTKYEHILSGQKKNVELKDSVLIKSNQKKIKQKIISLNQAFESQSNMADQEEQESHVIDKQRFPIYNPSQLSSSREIEKRTSPQLKRHKSCNYSLKTPEKKFNYEEQFSHQKISEKEQEKNSSINSSQSMKKNEDSDIKPEQIQKVDRLQSESLLSSVGLKTKKYKQVEKKKISSLAKISQTSERKEESFFEQKKNPDFESQNSVSQNAEIKIIEGESTQTFQQNKSNKHEVSSKEVSLKFMTDGTQKVISEKQFIQEDIQQKSHETPQQNKSSKDEVNTSQEKIEEAYKKNKMKEKPSTSEKTIERKKKHQQIYLSPYQILHPKTSETIPLSKHSQNENRFSFQVQKRRQQSPPVIKETQSFQIQVPAINAIPTKPIIINYRSLSPKTIEQLARKSPIRIPVEPKIKKPLIKFHQIKSPKFNSHVENKVRITSNMNTPEGRTNASPRHRIIQNNRIQATSKPKINSNYDKLSESNESGITLYQKHHNDGCQNCQFQRKI